MNRFIIPLFLVAFLAGGCVADRGALVAERRQAYTTIALLENALETASTDAERLAITEQIEEARTRVDKIDRSLAGRDITTSLLILAASVLGGGGGAAALAYRGKYATLFKGVSTAITVLRANNDEDAARTVEQCCTKAGRHAPS